MTRANKTRGGRSTADRASSSIVRSRQRWPLSARGSEGSVHCSSRLARSVVYRTLAADELEERMAGLRATRVHSSLLLAADSKNTQQIRDLSVRIENSLRLLSADR